MPLPLQRSITPGRCIVFLICLSLTVMLSVSSSNPEVEPLPHHDVQFVPRQDPSSPIPPSSPTSTPTPTSSTTSETTSRPNVVSSTTSQPTPTSTPQTPTSTPPPPTNTPTSLPPVVSSVESTGSDGSKTVIIVTVSGSSSSTPTPSSTPKGDESSGLGTGSIIGLSVAGGIALLGIIAFFIWKFTRKRRSATYDDGEIKWPDLNSESHVAGQADHANVQGSTDGGSLRDPSFRGAYGDGGLGASQSQVDLYAADPYAVPPLPHLNPNQPYRDDPGAAPYHDSFNPPGFHESRPSSPSIRGEVIPMNQINRTKSPGPQAGLPPGYGAGRQSPGPQEAFGGGYGRQSPGPQDAYGGGYGRRSPGPHDAYGPR